MVVKDTNCKQFISTVTNKCAINYLMTNTHSLDFLFNQLAYLDFDRIIGNQQQN